MEFWKNMCIRLLKACTVEIFGGSLASTSKRSVKCVSWNNWPSQARATLIDINSNETSFCPFPISVTRCDGSCDTITNPYTPACVPNKVKKMNIKVFNLMSGVSETRLLAQHESCECKSGLNKNFCNSKQQLTHDEWKYDC